MENKKKLLCEVGSIFFEAIKEAKALTESLDKMNVFIADQERLIIKKSGETFVSRFNNIDYLWIGKDPLNVGWEIREVNEVGFLSENWKSFTGDKPTIDVITDETAKLRPMCWSSCGVFLLWGIDEGNTAISNNHNFVASKIRLATIDELP